MNIRKIIVGVDTSAESIRALEEAMPIARRSGAEIVLAHVGDLYEAREDTWLSGSAAHHYRELLASRSAKMREEVGAIREAHLGQGVDISVVLLSGFADTALAEAATEVEADLVVVGSLGLTGVKRFLLGGVAERVVRLASVDVLVARTAKPLAPYRSILVATDFSAAAEAALTSAIALGGPDAVITLVHCWHLPVSLAGYPGSLAALRSSIEGSATTQIEQLAKRYAANAQIRTELIYGEAAHRIHERAAGCDLIAMGSHGRRGLRRWILGSVAERTVRHAPCSVFVSRSR